MVKKYDRMERLPERGREQGELLKILEEWATSDDRLWNGEKGMVWMLLFCF